MIASSLISSTTSATMRILKAQSKLVGYATSMSSATSTCSVAVGSVSSSLPMVLVAAAAAAAATTVTGTMNFDNSKSTQCEQQSMPRNSSTFQVRNPNLNRDKQPTLKTRMTSVGRFSILSETARNPSIPCMVLALTGSPLTTDDFCRYYKERGLLQRHPRFGAKLDPTNTYFVAPTTASTKPSNDKQPEHALDENDVYKHVKEIFFPLIYRTELKALIDDAITQPLNLLEGLWQVRIATGGNIGQSGALSHSRLGERGNSYKGSVESLLMFRAHHCMADGVSLSAIFTDLVDEAPELHAQMEYLIQQYKTSSRKKRKSLWKRLLILIHYWWWGTIRAVLYQCNLYIQMWMASSANPWIVLENQYYNNEKNKKGDMDRTKRTLSWCEVATVDQVKQVAKHFSNQLNSKSSMQQRITINDIFASCVSAAIAKLVEYHRQTKPHLSLPTMSHMNLVMPVHMQGGILLPGQSLGNKIGAMVCRIPAEVEKEQTQYHKEGESDLPSSVRSRENRLRQVHEQVTAIKQTPAAFWSYLTAKAFGSLGFGGGAPSEDGGGTVMSWLFSKAHANASAVLTNVRGPDKAVHLGGRKIETTLGFLPLPPGIPVGVVVSSYAGNVTLSVTGEPWAVPDADLFLLWVVEEYQALLRQSLGDK